MENCFTALAIQEVVSGQRSGLHYPHSIKEEPPSQLSQDTWSTRWGKNMRRLLFEGLCCTSSLLCVNNQRIRVIGFSPDWEQYSPWPCTIAFFQGYVVEAETWAQISGPQPMPTVLVTCYTSCYLYMHVLKITSVRKWLAFWCCHNVGILKFLCEEFGA